MATDDSDATVADETQSEQEEEGEREGGGSPSLLGRPKATTNSSAM